MSSALPVPEVGSQAVRAALAGIQATVCVVCGGPRAPRKQAACSNRCRAALARQRQGGRLRTGLVALRDGLRLLRAQVDDRLAEVDALLAATRGRDEERPSC